MNQAFQPSYLFVAYEQVSYEKEGCWADTQLVQGGKAKYVRIFLETTGLGRFSAGGQTGSSKK